MERFGRGRSERFLRAGDQASEPGGSESFRGPKVLPGGHPMCRIASDGLRRERLPRRRAPCREGGSTALSGGAQTLHRNERQRYHELIGTRPRVRRGSVRFRVVEFGLRREREGAFFRKRSDLQSHIAIRSDKGG